MAPRHLTPAIDNPGPSGSSKPPKPYTKRPYAHACLACKARKIKCEEAGTPPCKGCRLSGLVCELPDRHVRRKRNHSPSPPAPPHQTPRPAPLPETTPRRAMTVEDRLRRIESVLGIASSPPPSGHRESQSPLDEAMDPPKFQLGGDDHPVYHGETSMHDDVTDASFATKGASTNRSVDVSGWKEEDLRALTRLRHKFASADEGEMWIDACFCWTSPTYAVVNRAVFLRDMALDGPMFSHLLLLAIYISGLRFSPNIPQEERESKASRFMGIVNNMIVDELGKPSSIPTAQALLTLAGRQCSVGERTQAWLFTGLAIRMIQDLGIHLAIDDPSLDAHFPQEVKDQRVRLYWSAYCWDKTISLGLGREPTMTCRPESFPEVKLNESEDDWVWRPVFPGGSHLEKLLQYPPVTIRTSYVLQYSCQLNLILESILVNMYSPHRPNARSVSFIQETDERLLQWRKQLPKDLLFDRSCLPDYCPPTNITNLNLLYFAMRILLYRPLLTVRNQPSGITNSSFEICRSAAIDIHEILSCWGRTFGNINMVYLIMYCTFLAAGIDVVLLRIGDGKLREEALKRVHLSLAILEQASEQGPGIRRGIAIISNQLQAATMRLNGNATLAPSSLSRAESSVRMGLGNSAPNVVTDVSDVAPHPSALLSAAYGSGPESQFDFPPFFDDPSNQQAIAELLGESHVGTDDPFAFLSGEGWDEMRF